MRIAYVCGDAGIPVFGTKGASVHVQGVAGAMHRAGHSVTLFCARRGDHPPVWADDVSVVGLDLPPERDGLSRTEWVREANSRMAATIRRHGPFDLVYERYSLWSHAVMEDARDRGVPAVLEVNAPLMDEAAAHRGLVDRDEAWQVASRAFRAASTVVAVSQEVADHVQLVADNVASVVVEANGVDLSRFADQRPPAGTPFTLGFVGTLKPWHGLELLADTFALVRRDIGDARLVIVGDGPSRDVLERRLAEHGVSAHVRFTGKVAPRAVGEALGGVHVALAPYTDDAPFYFSPLKVVEYQAAGVPVVASAVGQLTTLVRHGLTGLLAPAGDARALADACIQLHDEPLLARQLAERARREVARHRSWEAVVERILWRALSTARPGLGSRNDLATVLI